MATSGRGSGTVGYNVQTAVDTKHHLIVTHEVTNVGNDRSQLSPMAKQAKATLGVDRLDVVADRGYFSSDEILACEAANISVTLRKPQTSGSRLQAAEPKAVSSKQTFATWRKKMSTSARPANTSSTTSPTKKRA
jgi:hypothetical protein